MKFRNDITPEDYMLITGESLYYIVAYSTENLHVPMVIRVIDSDAWGWYRGILYDVNDKGNYLSEWPKTWKWAKWEVEGEK